MKLSAVATLLLFSSCASVVRSHIYAPQPMPASVSWSGRAPAEVSATTADGLTLRGYYWAPQTPGGDVILFFHGKTGNRYTAARMAEPLAAGGGLLVASYRGYGDNPGMPSESGLYADARAFVALAGALAPKSRLYLFGYSLGAAPALHAAAEESVEGVVILGAFATLRDVAPPLSRPLLPDRFDNLASIARVDEPILLLHGTGDDIVPIAQAEALKAHAPHGVRFLRVEGAGHVVDFSGLAPIVWDNIRQMPR